MRCFWCGAVGVQHVDPCEEKCLGGDGGTDEMAIDAGLARALNEVAEEARLAADDDRDVALLIGQAEIPEE